MLTVQEHKHKRNSCTSEEGNEIVSQQVRLCYTRADEKGEEVGDRADLPGREVRASRQPDIGTPII